jgi:hypothetical protein
MTLIEKGSRLLLGGALVLGGVHACDRIYGHKPIGKDEKINCRVLDKTEKYAICAGPSFKFSLEDQPDLILVWKDNNGIVKYERLIIPIEKIEDKTHYRYSRIYDNSTLFRYILNSINYYVVFLKNGTTKLFESENDAKNYANEGYLKDFPMIK